MSDKKIDLPDWDIKFDFIKRIFNNNATDISSFVTPKEGAVRNWINGVYPKEPVEVIREFLILSGIDKIEASDYVYKSALEFFELIKEKSKHEIYTRNKKIPIPNFVVNNYIDSQKNKNTLEINDLSKGSDLAKDYNDNNEQFEKNKQKNEITHSNRELKRNPSLFYNLVEFSKKILTTLALTSYTFKALLLITIIILIINFHIIKLRQISIIGPEIVQNNEAIIIGKCFPKIIQTKFSNLSDYNSNIRILIFINPNDKENKYWLNETQKIEIINNNGIFYQTCRFGDEVPQSMIKYPLNFNVYAACADKSNELPKSPIIAASEKDFIQQVNPYVKNISKKFIVERIPDLKEKEIAIPVMTSPVRFTWAGNYKKYLEFYHNGILIKSGYFNRETTHKLLASPIFYEVKISKNEAHPKSNMWFLIAK